MGRHTRATAATVALVDASVALLPKVAAYGLFEVSPLESPVGSAEWGLAAFAVFALVVLAPYSYRRCRRDARLLAVTRSVLAGAREAVTRLRGVVSARAYFS